MTFIQHPNFLRTVLLVDAATCLATGLLMTAGADPLAGLMQIPADLLFYAGASLFPIAAFIALVGTRQAPPPVGVWLVIVGISHGWPPASGSWQVARSAPMRSAIRSLPSRRQLSLCWPSWNMSACAN
jgi:hypothetical protein